MEILRTRGIDPETGSPVQGAPAVQPAQPTEPTQPNNFAGYTDEQLANAIPGFNALSADEKQVIRDAKNTAKTVAELQRQLAVVLDERETNKQIGELKKNDAFKAIAENEAAFREFIYRPENLELNIEHLAYKFMSELAAGTITPTQPEAPAQPTQPGMEGNTGGGKQVNDATANGVREMTAAEAAELRKSDHRTYNELARTGKLKIVTRQ